MTASKMHQRDTTRTFGLPGSKSLAGIREALGIPLQEMATSLGLSAAALAIYERHPGWLSAQQLEPFAESYHAWSSDGKWILFASRRDDTNYSRLYIARMNADGTAEKAFLLPQESAEFYDFFDRSYNVPEFMIEPVKFTPQEFAEVAKGESVNVKYSSNIK